LVDHHQPELAETFFNSVTTKILHRSYFHNNFIFVRPAVSTEYIEDDEPAAKPTYRAYYPAKSSLPDTLARVVNNFQFSVDFENLSRDIGCMMRTLDEHFQKTEGASLQRLKLRANFQIQVLSSLFFRNKGAYIVGKIINGFTETAVCAAGAAQQDGAGGRHLAASGKTTLLLLFSFARAYFMVDMEIPQRLRAVPAQPDARQAARRALQRAGSAEARQERCSTATCCTTCATPATSSASRPASRAW
jgi:isocitrate dehydrogenase kinase/phosphatase